MCVFPFGGPTFGAAAVVFGWWTPLTLPSVPRQKRRCWTVRPTMFPVAQKRHVRHYQALTAQRLEQHHDGGLACGCGPCVRGVAVCARRAYGLTLHSRVADEACVHRLAAVWIDGTCRGVVHFVSVVNFWHTEGLSNANLYIMKETTALLRIDSWPGSYSC